MGEETASGTAPTASDAAGWSTAPASETATKTAKRVWVQFKKGTPHASALGSVQATIVSNLGASEADAANLLVPESNVSGNSTATGSYPFTMHYDFYDSKIPFMVMSVDESTMSSLKSDPNVASIEEDPERYPLAAVQDEETDTLNRQLQENGPVTQGEYTPPGIIMAKADKAWAMGYKGKGVKVCVLDTGLDVYHPEFTTSWSGKSSGGGKVSSLFAHITRPLVGLLFVPYARRLPSTLLFNYVNQVVPRCTRYVGDDRFYESWGIFGPTSRIASLACCSLPSSSLFRSFVRCC
jgi:subtilisin family serine protease